MFGLALIWLFLKSTLKILFMKELEKTNKFFSIFGFFLGSQKAKTVARLFTFRGLIQNF